MLHVTLHELAAGAQQDLRAQHLRRGPAQRQRVLKLVTKPRGATSLIKARLGPQAARHGLIEQPAVDERVEQRVGRLHLRGLQQIDPLRLRLLQTQRGRHAHRLCGQLAGGLGSAGIAHQKHPFQRGACRHADASRHRRARVQAGAGALAQVVGYHQATTGIKKLAAVAGPVGVAAVFGAVAACVAACTGAGSGLAAHHREKGRACTKTSALLLLRGQQHTQPGRVGTVTAQARAPQCRADTGAVGARGAQLPFDQANEPPMQRARALVVDVHLHLLDGAGRVHAPGQHHLDLTATVAHAVADAGAALAVLHTVAAVWVGMSRRRQAPDFAVARVLQPQPVRSLVSQRVVGPGGELVHAAVDSPGVATPRFRHMAAETGVGQHVDPRPGGPQQAVHVEFESATVRVELALRRRHGSRWRADHWHSRGGRLFTLLHISVMRGRPGPHVARQRPAVSLQVHTRQAVQRGQLAWRQLLRTQHKELGHR